MLFDGSQIGRVDHNGYGVDGDGSEVFSHAAPVDVHLDRELPNVGAPEFDCEGEIVGGSSQVF